MNRKTAGFKKKLIATTIASYALMGMSGMALAQDNGNIEEIVVTGIKGSLQRAMDIKRDAKGVVDAISAEDIGKFPDTNLAESLQRITGVSIDRVNGEGSKVTVRGFGPDFNMVTLNGRQMPVSGLEATIVNSTRSFDFANLAAEGVSGVSVYKTGRADVATGGIGATIDISTARPLDNPGLKATVSTKAVFDTSVNNGDDVTPEVSGLFSNTFADDTIGVLLSGSYQKRDNGVENGNASGWITKTPADFGDNTIVDNSANQQPGGTLWYPQNVGFAIGDVERTRINGQLALQYAPTDRLKATLDYTYSELESESARVEFGAWYNGGGNANYVTMDENGTAINFEETGGDFSSNRIDEGSRNENNSVGFNLEWQATDTLAFEFDYHDSTAESTPLRYGNSALITMGANNTITKTFDGSTEIPTIDFLFPTASGEAVPGDYEVLQAFARQGHMKTDIEQYQIDGKWQNQDNSGLVSINFGVASTEMTQDADHVEQFLHTPAWGYTGKELFDDSLFTRHPTGDFMDEFSGGMEKMGYYYDYDLEQVMPIAMEGAFTADSRPFGDPDLSQQARHIVTEETDSAYIQLEFESSINGLPLNILTGVRWEGTDVTSQSSINQPTAVIWANSTEWRTELAAEKTLFTGTGSYNVFLPSLDMSLNIRDDLIARFSYSKTITRSNLSDMRSAVGVSGAPKLGQRTASAGDPGLLPYTSDNIDLSLEWYYGDSSYISLGYFHKDVDNFIASRVFEESLFGLTDAYIGERAQTARQQLTDEGVTALTDDVVLARILQNEGISEVKGDSTDPLLQWQVTRPVNAENAELYGWEFAVQHVFGDSGFGTGVNFTMVEGDVGYDVAVTDYQFALPGLSDSANFMAFYDKNGIQARIAYNWRDEFLVATGTGTGNHPRFREAYGQWDISASYDINDNLTVFLEGINILEETSRDFSRYEEQFLGAEQFGARYNLGARYTF